MNEKMISFISFEAMQARNERTTKRLTFAIVVCVFLLVCSNAAWLVWWLL